MAVLRTVEERDAKGNTVRVNPTTTFKQDRQIRRITGRNDYAYIDNPEFHPPITAQAQNGKIIFFIGVPDNAQTRSAAKEISQAEVEKLAPYVLAELRRRPMRVREARPTVYEVKLATIGDVTTTEVSEVESSDGVNVVVTAVEPDINPHLRGGRAAATTQAAAE